MLPCSRNVGHVFVQDVLLGADAVILNVLGPVQLAHVKVKSLQRDKNEILLTKKKTQLKSFYYFTTRWRQRTLDRVKAISRKKVTVIMVRHQRAIKTTELA